MIRYRCPHCAAPTTAHERRAGQSSVCKACLKPHTIPADNALWLNDLGEPLHAPAAPAAVEPPAPPAPFPDLPATLPDLGVHLIPVSEPAVAVARLAEQSATRPDLQLPEVVAVAPPVPRVERPAPPVPPRPPEPVAVEEPRPEPEPVAVATLTPPPVPAPAARSRPPVAPAPVATPAPRARSFVPARVTGAPPIQTSAEPVQLQTQADIAVALTAALTSRMKPPATPRRDLRPSTAAWMLLTGLGIALVLVALFTDTGYRWAALAVGAVQIVLGYVWIVRLTHMRDPNRGAMCAVPPLTLYYLGQYKYAKLRPLRFVATGAAILGLALLVPGIAPHTQALFRRAEPVPEGATNPAAQSKLAQLRHYREHRSYDALCKVLEELAKTDPLHSKEKQDGAELAVELKGLCAHTDTEVRVRAMAAYARWDPAGARAVCLAAVRSQSFDDRMTALRLLPHWKDADAARAAQSLIGRPGAETNQARASLEEIGGEAAELAAEALLNRASDQGARLTGLAVMEKVAGPARAEWLRAYALAAEDTAVRNRAFAAADAVAARAKLSVPPPKP